MNGSKNIASFGKNGSTRWGRFCRNCKRRGKIVVEKNDFTGSEFLIRREFDAPRELVWDAWTDPNHLMQWFAPKGFKMIGCKMDLRPGGEFQYGQQGPGGLTMWGKWTFREVVRPQRLVLVQSFSDEQGGVTRHPLS